MPRCRLRFETITIAFQGEVEHGDSLGNGGVIGEGDVQWMTAGRGIVHEEYHSRQFAKTGGTFEMCQLWLNLPAKDKMTAPRYQPITKADIPVAPILPDDPAAGEVRVIAGDYRGTVGAAKTFTPVNLWDVLISGADTDLELPLPKAHNAIVFVRKGSIELFGGDMVGAQAVALLNQDGDAIRLKATSAGTQIVVLAGEPIDEPIAARGPFVMNTMDEIRQANMDYHSGKLGK